MTTRLAAVAAAGLALGGCELVQQVMQVKTFAHCQFRLAGVDRPTLAGVAIGGRRRLKDLGVMDAIRITAAAKSRQLPLAFTLNVEVKNPNAETAAMNRLAWILLIDGREMTRGDVAQRVEVAASGGVATLPLAITLDLPTLLAGDSLDSMLNLAFNVAGEGTHPTHVSLKAKPSVLVGGQSMELPDYITVSTEFGGHGGAAPAP